MIAILQRLFRSIIDIAPYPRLLQGLVSLILIATPFSVPRMFDNGMLLGGSERFWTLVGLVGCYLVVVWTVPVRRLPRWVQLLYLIGQCGLTFALWVLLPAPMLDYVYLTIVLQAIYLFRAWLWIPFAGSVWLVWSGTLMIASASLMEWLQSNLALAFPATCVLIAAILYARQNRRHEQVQQLLQQVQRHYDAMVLAVRDVQQRAALEERDRLAETITSEVNAALAQAEQSVSTAISQAQLNLARLQTTIVQTRVAAGAAIEHLRNAVTTLRHGDFDPPAPPAQATTLALSLNDPLLPSLAARVLTWVLPLVFVTLALPMTLIRRPLNVEVLASFLLFCGALLLAYVLTQRVRSPIWFQAGLVGQASAVLALALLTQTIPLLLGLLLVMWQIALRFPTGQIVAFLAGLQAAIGAVVMRLLPVPLELSTNLLLFGVACAAVAGLLWMAHGQLNRRHQDERDLARLTKLTDELEQQVAEVRMLAVAAERTRLAREFHDDLGSQLILINVQLQLAEELINEDPNAALEQLVTTREQLRVAWRSVLTAADATLTLSGSSLESALRDLVRQCRPLTPAQIDLRITGTLDALTPLTACTIYRAAQEGLTNACKYAHASRIEIHIIYESDQVGISICDDGQGPWSSEPALPTTTPVLIGIQGNFGLVGLRERAELLGGRLTAGPMPGSGFCLHLTVPLDVPSDEKSS